MASSSRLEVDFEIAKIKTFMQKEKLSLRELSKKINVSVGSLCNFFKGDIPKRKWELIKKGFQNFGNEEISSILENIDNIVGENKEENVTQNREAEDMILRKQNLTMEAKRHFGFIKNPFSDPQKSADLFFTKRTRFVRECLLDAAKNGNFLAIVGESGAGKSTLRGELIENLRMEDANVVIIEPSTLTMSANAGYNGDTLKARHIMQAILQTLKPNMPCGGSSEILARKVQKALVDSKQAGYRHCLIIEEAHDLHTQTLKHLKRFWELVDGMERLLSIVLIGQPELSRVLGTSNADIREVVQRCDVVELTALDNVSEFLAFRFERAGYNILDFFDESGLEAIYNKLFVAKSKEGKTVFYGYPLAISNLAVACLNVCANLGEDKVNAQIVAQVQR